MGTDIHSVAEVRQDGSWKRVGPVFTAYGHQTPKPFSWRSYALFGFLADVRNYSECDPISEPKGLPDDFVDENEWRESVSKFDHSWLSLAELLAFDYERTFWDRRIEKNGNGAARAEEGEGAIITYREHLSPAFFEELKILKSLGPPDEVRVVFCFSG